MSRVGGQGVLWGAKDIAGARPEREELRSCIDRNTDGCEVRATDVPGKVGRSKRLGRDDGGRGPDASSASLCVAEWRREMRRRTGPAPRPAPRPAWIPRTRNERLSISPPRTIYLPFEPGPPATPVTTPALSSRSPLDSVIGRGAVSGGGGAQCGLNGAPFCRKGTSFGRSRWC